MPFARSHAKGLVLTVDGAISPQTKKGMRAGAEAPAPCFKGSAAARLRKGLKPEGPRLLARHAKPSRASSLALQARFVRLLNVHADQDEMILDHLDATGAMARVEAGELNFDLLDTARTRSALGSVLGRR